MSTSAMTSFGSSRPNYIRIREKQLRNSFATATMQGATECYVRVPKERKEGCSSFLTTANRWILTG